MTTFSFTMTSYAKITDMKYDVIQLFGGQFGVHGQ